MSAQKNLAIFTLTEEVGQLRAKSCLLRKLRGPSRQALDAFGDWGMGREQAAEVHSQQWLDDEQVRGRGCRLHRDAARVGVEFLQGAGESIGIAGEMRACRVGLIFA